MINDDLLVKLAVNNIKKGYLPDNNPLYSNWVDYVKYLKSQIKYIREGFKGISDTDLSIIGPDKIQCGMRIILDDNLDANCGTSSTDHAAILGKVISINGPKVDIVIDGIGQGFDFTRDPDRVLRWGYKYTINNINAYHMIIQLDSVPKSDGGPIYYYYNKSTRDERY